jgi:hypothetical protein
MLEAGYITNETMQRPSEVKPVTISKITGRLANANTPDEFKVETLAYNSAKMQEDGAYTQISVDNVC